MDKTRLNKYISETGMCSRREADKLIESGQVKVNGIVATLGTTVDERDKITVKNKPLLVPKKKKVYIALHKSVGITSTTDRRDKDNIIDYLGFKERVFPIGRLDKMSEGLIFLTNDGDIVNKILRAGNEHEKEYVVTVDKAISTEFIKGMANGVTILNTVTLPCKIYQINKHSFNIVLTQGLNRQIRRMCEVFGYEVKKLVRVRIMNITLKGLEVGQWRYLTDKEMKEIESLVRVSVKTEDASTAIQKQSNYSKLKAKDGTKLKAKDSTKMNSKKPLKKNNYRKKA